MRILFIKTSSLGDVIHHCPSVTDVHRSFPESTIDWVVEEAFAEIVGLHPSIRRAIPVAVRRWRHGTFQLSVWKEILEFRRLLRTDQYDFVIDTQGLLKSALIATSARGITHGFDIKSVREPIASQFYDVRHSVRRDMHAVDRNRALTAMALEIDPAGHCDYGLIAGRDVPIAVAMPFFVLLTMTSRSEKLWPERRWAELAKELAVCGFESVLPWGNEAECARCQRIVELAGSGIVPRALSLGELASLMTRAKGVVGLDTGLAHLAAALNVPAIGLYLRTDPLLTGLHGKGKIANLGGTEQLPAVGEVLKAVEAML